MAEGIGNVKNRLDRAAIAPGSLVAKLWPVAGESGATS